MTLATPAARPYNGDTSRALSRPEVSAPKRTGSARVMQETTPSGEAAQEEWRAVPGYGGYYSVSSAGRVRSEPRAQVRKNGVPHTTRGRILRQSVTPNGYMFVSLWRAGAGATLHVHALVLGAFTGPRPTGCDASHINGVRTDNRPTNLEWESRAENEARKVGHGTSNRGERGGAAKLTERDVREARARNAKGETCTALAQEYHVAFETMRAAVRGRNWSHIQ